MTTLHDALAAALHRASCCDADEVLGEHEEVAALVLTDPALVEALVEALAGGLHGDWSELFTLTNNLDGTITIRMDARRAATAIVPRMLGEAGT